MAATKKNTKSTADSEESPVETNKTVSDSKSILSKFLKENKSDHYNFEEDIDYKVSTGSLILDSQMNGGFGPGLHRFCGINEGGKTSEALEVMRNFLNTVPNSKGYYIKAERLTEEMRERSGIKFVYSAEEWEVGTCFVFECSKYEVVVDSMRQLIMNNSTKVKFLFILDSVDGLLSKGDEDKSFEDSNKVAGGAVIAANFMKRVAIALSKRGHMAIFISQVRADIKLDPYSKAPVRQTTATGGNALLHFANWIFEFLPRYGEDNILKDPKNKKIDVEKNPLLGHWTKVLIKKSPNEKTNLTLKYPICYQRTGGNSIWIEKEIVDLLIAWQLLDDSSSWLKQSEDMIELLDKAGLGGIIPDKMHGLPEVYRQIEASKPVRDFLFDHFKKLIVLERNATIPIASISSDEVF